VEFKEINETSVVSKLESIMRHKPIFDKKMITL